jgi:AraC-like DNA-binding protein
MAYHVIEPPKHLADYVRCFWVLECDAPYRHHAVADGLAEMVFHYRGTFQEIRSGREESSWLSGVQAQAQRARQFVTHTGFGIFGVYLYPYALSTLFSMPAYALSNEIPDLQTLLGDDGKMLEEQMMLADDHHQRIRIICTFIESKLARQRMPLDKSAIAVRQVIEQGGQLSVKKLAHDFGVSVRHFERCFKSTAGFSPKLYIRIVRFGAAIKAYSLQEVTLTTLAHASGYYDQSHFIEDFKMFSGVSPTAYFRARQA